MEGAAFHELDQKRLCNVMVKSRTEALGTIRGCFERLLPVTEAHRGGISCQAVPVMAWLVSAVFSCGSIRQLTSFHQTNRKALEPHDLHTRHRPTQGAHEILVRCCSCGMRSWLEGPGVKLQADVCSAVPAYRRPPCPSRSKKLLCGWQPCPSLSLFFSYM